MPCSFLDVRERQITIFIGDVDDLIEPRDGVTHVLCVGQRFFALFGKCINASWQVTLVVSPLHSDYERVMARTVAEMENGARPWFQPWKSST